jgi:hypothetical protein
VSGIVAVVAVDRRAGVSEGDYDTMVKCYQAIHGDAAVTHCHSNKIVRAALVGSRGGTVASAVEDDGSWLLAAGRVVDDRGRPVSRPQALHGLDGQFAAVVHDGRRDEVVVATDPLGYTPVYVGERAGTAYVSTSSLAVARVIGAAPDRLGIQGFLLSGYHFGTGTHWRDVHRLDPGHAFHFTSTGRSVRRYWAPSVADDVQRMPLRRAVDHCIDVAVETFRTRLSEDGGAWIDLTGGFDSRLMALLLRRAGVPVRANTRHAPDPRDVRIAGRVAAAMGVPWVAPALPAEWPELLPTLLRWTLACGDANLEVLQLARVLWVHRLLARTSGSLLSAGGGEHFQYAAWKSEFRQAGRSTRVNLDNWIDMRMLKPSSRSVLLGNPLPTVREDYRQRLASWIAAYGDEPNTTQLDRLYAYKSTGHFGAYRAADESVLSAQLPLYFRPVFEAAVSVDFHHRNNHRLMRHMMSRLDPTVAAITTTRGAPAQPWRPGNTHRFAPYYGQLARKAVTKVSEKAIGVPLLLDNLSFPWSGEANATVVEEMRRVGVLAPERMRSASLFDAQRLSQLLAEASRPGFNGTPMLGRIITVELALEAAGAAL